VANKHDDGVWFTTIRLMFNSDDFRKVEKAAKKAGKTVEAFMVEAVRRSVNGKSGTIEAVNR